MFCLQAKPLGLLPQRVAETAFSLFEFFHIKKKNRAFSKIVTSFTIKFRVGQKGYFFKKMFRFKKETSLFWLVKLAGLYRVSPRFSEGLGPCGGGLKLFLEHLKLVDVLVFHVVFDRYIYRICDRKLVTLIVLIIQSLLISPNIHQMFVISMKIYMKIHTSLFFKRNQKTSRRLDFLISFSCKYRSPLLNTFVEVYLSNVN